MNAEEIKQTLLDAIEFAVKQDSDCANEYPRYAESVAERSARRARAVLTYLSNSLPDSEPALHKAFKEFLDPSALGANAAEARARNAHLAASERFTHAAPEPAKPALPQ